MGLAAPSRTNAIGQKQVGFATAAPARGASKFGAVPMSRGASVTMSASSNNIGEKLSSVATSVTQQFDQFMNDIAPQ